MARTIVDTGDVKITQQKEILMSSHGATIDMPESEIEVAPAIESNYANDLAFAEQKVEVVVHESTDPNAEPIVEVFNNGVRQNFIRGQAIFVKRKFVEVLARAKATGIQTQEYADNVGDRGVRILRHTALKYPFSVMQDPSPKGSAWLKGILAEAA